MRDLSISLASLVHQNDITFTPADLKLIKVLKKDIDENSEIILENAKNKYLNPDYTIEDKDQGITESMSNTYEESPPYQKVVKLLRKIRERSRPNPKLNQPDFSQLVKYDANAPLIRYAYIIIALPKNSKLPLVIDIADSNYKKISKNSEEDSADLGIPFGTFLKLEPAYEAALTNNPTISTDWITDKWGTWLTIATPIFDENQQIIAALAIDYDVNNSKNSLHAMLREAYFFIFLSILLSICFAIFISRQLSKPIRLLINAAEKVSEHDFTAKVNIHSDDEIGKFANVFNNMTTEIQQYSTNLENLVDSYARFVPMEFLKLLDLPSILDVKLGDQIEKTMAVLFCDLRSFTSTIESMSPREAFQYLNDYMLMAAPIIREHNGFIDKFIGDSIMALFPKDATDAVECAITLLTKLEKYNQRLKKKTSPIRVAMGIHAGKLMLGTVGEQGRLEGTVISDVVNFAARLESTSKLLGVVSIISADAKDNLKPDNTFEFRYLGKMRAKGKTVSIGVYELLDALPTEIKEAKIKTRDLFEEAIRQYEQGKKKEARQLFKKVLAQSPLDSVAAIYFELLTTPNSPYTQYFG